MEELPHLELITSAVQRMTAPELVPPIHPLSRLAVKAHALALGLARMRLHDEAGRAKDLADELESLVEFPDTPQPPTATRVVFPDFQRPRMERAL